MPTRHCPQTLISPVLLGLKDLHSANICHKCQSESNNLLKQLSLTKICCIDVRPGTIWIGSSTADGDTIKLVAPMYAKALIDMHKSNPFLKKSVEEVIPETWWVESQAWPPYALLTLAAMTGGVRRRWKGRTYTPLGGTCGTSQYCAFNVYGDLPYWNGSKVYEKSWRKVGKELPKHVFNRTPHVFFSLSLSEDETPSQDILNILRSMLAHQSSRRIDAGRLQHNCHRLVVSTVEKGSK